MSPGKSLRETHQQQKRASLPSGHEFLQALGSLGLGVAILDREFRVTHSNTQAANFLATPQENLAGAFIRDVAPKKVLKKIMKGADRAFRGEADPRIEEFFPHPVGLWLRCFFRPCGEGLMVVMEDVTETRETASLYRMLSDRFDLMQQASLAGVWDWEIPTGKLEWTPGMFSLFGLDPQKDAASFETWKRILHPQDRESALLNIDQALKDHAVLFNVYRIMLPDGKIRWINAVGRGIYDKTGSPVRMIGICLDHTEHKKREETLKRQAALIDLTPNAIMTLLADGTITFWSRGAESLYGWTKEEALGRKACGLVSSRLPSDLELIMQETARQGNWSGEFHDQAKDGREILVSSTWLAQYDDEGSMCEVFVSNIDITGRRAMEGELREHLERLVVERTAELKEKNRALHEEMAEKMRAQEEKQRVEAQLLQMQKIEALGSFAGGIAHDLNNVLHPIIMNTEMLLDKERPGSEDYEMLKQVLESAYRQKDLVKQILSFSREDRQKMRPVRVVPLVEKCLGFIRSTLSSTIEIEFTGNALDDRIMGDFLQIEQVVMNLCRNAADAIEPHTGKIRVSVSDVRLEADAFHSGVPQGGYLAVSVQDTGCGIPATDLNRIFDPFFTTKPTGRGSGLGLSVVHGIVKKHKGAMAVKSEEGKGSRFTVYLPLSGQNMDARASDRSAPSSSRKKVLLIDDEHVIVSTLKRVLKRLGYAVMGMTDPMEALELFFRNPETFDLVITDMTMPKITGRELGKRILEIRPDIPVIMCTGFSDIISSTELKDLGFSGLLMKPAGIDELRTVVKEAFGE